MNTYVVDTHALIWFLDGDSRLGAQAREILRDESIPLVIPSIVLAEMKYLAHKRHFSKSMEDVLRVVSRSPRCLIYPADLSVVVAAPPELDIHDSIIVGTALALQRLLEGITILTKDEAIIRAGIVPTTW